MKIKQKLKQYNPGKIRKIGIDKYTNRWNVKIGDYLVLPT